jgi:hypothetical protein
MSPSSGVRSSSSTRPMMMSSRSPSQRRTSPPLVSRRLSGPCSTLITW